MSHIDSASVLLLSGGIESVTLLHQLVDAGEPLQGVFIDFGQRAAKGERASAESHCARLGVELVSFDLAQVGEIFRRSQQRKAHLPIPHRNLTALALGASYAMNLNAARVYLAANRDDASAHASASHTFLAQFRLICGLLGEVQLATPYIGLAKSEIIDRGLQLGVDYETTYSCLLGHPLHCGRCVQCMKRRDAFETAGIREPESFYRS